MSVWLITYSPNKIKTLVIDVSVKHAVAGFCFFFLAGKKSLKKLWFLGLSTSLWYQFMVYIDWDSLFCSCCCQETPGVLILGSPCGPISCLLLLRLHQSAAVLNPEWEGCTNVFTVPLQLSPWGVGGRVCTQDCSLPVNMHAYIHACMYGCLQKHRLKKRIQTHQHMVFVLFSSLFKSTLKLLETSPAKM